MDWRDPTASMIVVAVLVVAAPVVYIVGIRVLIGFGLCWAIRPPFLREPVTAPPLVFFSNLPTETHSLLALDLELPVDDSSNN
eukprot:scaffold141637_cov24-Prasinocladus_malaysianus.AAC.1